MFSMGWFWIAIVVFFVMAPKWRRSRRGRWNAMDRWDPFRDDPRDRDREGPSPEDKERQERHDAQVEQLETRVAELESRLDFAERLLAPRREAAPAPTRQAAS